MRTIEVQLPTIDQVSFSIECLEEHLQIRGNALASGDDEEDKKEEARILAELENGNSWAWCCVKVTAKYRGLEGADYLGCCSYASQNDFEEGGYYEDMKQTAYNDLISQIEDLKP